MYNKFPDYSPILSVVLAAIRSLDGRVFLFTAANSETGPLVSGECSVTPLSAAPIILCSAVAIGADLPPTRGDGGLRLLGVRVRQLRN
jgi:hypothetical protein